jgi:hypothetical protein
MVLLAARRHTDATVQAGGEHLPGIAHRRCLGLQVVLTSPATAKPYIGQAHSRYKHQALSTREGVLVL